MNPLEWSSATIIRVFGAFFAIGLPLWFTGFSVFATNVNLPNATLEIAGIGLSSDVAPVEMKNRQLETPERIVGSYTNGNKVFLYGHSEGVFGGLKLVQVGDTLNYGEDDANVAYRVTRIVTLPVEKISMANILANTKSQELVLMTCAGERLSDGNYTERLIVYATSLGE